MGRAVCGMNGAVREDWRGRGVHKGTRRSRTI